MTRDHGHVPQANTRCISRLHLKRNIDNNVASCYCKQTDEFRRLGNVAQLHHAAVSDRCIRVFRFHYLIFTRVIELPTYRFIDFSTL